MSADPGGRFATTQWSLVLAAGERASPAGHEALQRLCTIYWRPVYAFVRRRGYSREQAEDVTQGFFARLIEKGDLRRADRNRGRFRSFLLSACQHYLSNERERASARKRGGGLHFASIDAPEAEERSGRALACAETPEIAFERQWVLTLLARVLDDLRDEYEATGRAAQFDRLKGFLTSVDDAGTHAQAARDLGVTPGAVKVAVHRLRKRYRESLHAAVAATVACEDDVADEIAYCLRVLAAR
ncbi:MAG: sigma-70 family RNA polymerase sigma factor [Vicinamibacteria bacterium]|nr:sigma-70 family RNA polymerase sigma factor [Vicinamibacteria bacterium]